MLFDPATLAAACLAVIIVGLAKGGFSGIARWRRQCWRW